jgi:hypothetical protein
MLSGVESAPSLIQARCGHQIEAAMEPIANDQERVQSRKTVYLDICESGETVVLAIRLEHARIMTSAVSAEEQLGSIRDELVQASLSGGLVVDINCPRDLLQHHYYEFFCDLIRATRRGSLRGGIGRQRCFTEDVRIAFCCAQFQTIRVLNVMGLGQIMPQKKLPNRVPIYRTLDEAVNAVSRARLRLINPEDP